MKKYIKNILLYFGALFGILAFCSLFLNTLEIYDSANGSWAPYNVHPYIGYSVNNYVIYKSSILPIFGYCISLVLGIVLIIESFKRNWVDKLHIINSIFAVMFFASAVLVLLTKENFLSINNFGQMQTIRNGAGPVTSAIFSFLAGLMLLVATWFPSKNELEFIDK